MLNGIGNYFILQKHIILNKEDTPLKNLENKKQIVDEIKQKLSNSKLAVFVDYKGISVVQDTAFRNSFRKENTEYKIYKNNLILRALDELGIKGCEEYLHGTTSLATSADSEVTPAKIVVNAKNDLQNLNVRFGLLNGKVVDSDYVTKLSKIPSKDVLIAQLMSMLNSPATKLAMTLKAIAEKE